MNGNGVLQGMSLLGDRLTKKLHELFGLQYARNAEHYIYEVTQTTGTADAAGTTYNAAIRITQEADFVATRLQITTRIVSVGTGVVGALVGVSNNQQVAGDWPDAPLTLQIVDGSTDRQLHSESIDAFGAYGTQGGLPGVWARPRLFARNTTLSLRLTSLKAVPASTVWAYRIQLIGWKIYDARALDLTTRQ